MKFGLSWERTKLVSCSSNTKRSSPSSFSQKYSIILACRICDPLKRLARCRTDCVMFSLQIDEPPAEGTTFVSNSHIPQTAAAETPSATQSHNHTAQQQQPQQHVVTVSDPTPYARGADKPDYSEKFASPKIESKGSLFHTNASRSTWPCILVSVVQCPSTPSPRPFRVAGLRIVAAQRRDQFEMDARDSNVFLMKDQHELRPDKQLVEFRSPAQPPQVSNL